MQTGIFRFIFYLFLKLIIIIFIYLSLRPSIRRTERAMGENTENGSDLRLLSWKHLFVFKGSTNVEVYYHDTCFVHILPKNVA